MGDIQSTRLKDFISAKYDPAFLDFSRSIPGTVGQ